MKFKQVTLLSVATLLWAGSIFAGNSLDTDVKKSSYAIGMQIGQDFKRSGLNIDVHALSSAISDVLGDKKPQLTEKETHAAMEFLRQQQMKKQTQIATKNKSSGEAFMAKNKSMPGVKTLESGVQYKIIKSGSGKSPTKENSVVVHYRGTLIDGTEFDSSIKRGKPLTFPVTGVIKGWTELLLLMKEGDKWQATIPADLAYGLRGSGQMIGPNATLIFDIELLEVK